MQALEIRDRKLDSFAVLGSLVMNPVTTPLFWTLSGTLGAAIFRIDASKVMTSVRNGERMHSLTMGAGIYLVGNTIIALVSAVIAYFLALRVVTVYREKRRERKRKVREERG